MQFLVRRGPRSRRQAMVFLVRMELEVRGLVRLMLTRSRLYYRPEDVCEAVCLPWESKERDGYGGEHVERSKSGRA